MLGPWVEDLTQGSHSESMHLCVFHGSSGHTINSLIPVLLSQLNLKEICFSISRAPQQGGYNCISSSTHWSRAWAWAFYSTLPLSFSPPSRLNLLFLLSKVGAYSHLFILSKLSQKDKDLDLTSSTSFSIMLTVCP